MIATVTIIGAALATLAAPSPFRRGTPNLTYQVDAAAFVCIGTVDKVFAVSFPDGIDADGTKFESRWETSLRFARIRVERVLKGNPGTTVVFHEAWPTWMCDDTSDRTGERSLFLLGPGVIAKASGSDRNLAVDALGSELILRNVGSGDGIVPIQRDGSHEYVVQWGWPESLRDPDSGKGWSLTRVLSWIETAARFSPESCVVHACCNATFPVASGRTESFDLRLLADGSRRLSKNQGGFVVVDRVDPPSWNRLQLVLGGELVEAAQTIGDEPGMPARSLAIRVNDRTLAFRQARDQSLESFGEASLLGLQRALRAWAAVWDVLDCPTCTDHRADDERFMLTQNR